MTEKTYALNSQEEIYAFWQKEVATKLDEQRILLLFVANDIPDELEPVVKFLNEHTRDNLEILAVEIKNRRGKSGGVPCCLCGCGAENNPGSRFKSGHDARLNGWLIRTKKSDFQIDGALTYAAAMCRNDSDLFKSKDNPSGRFYKKYTPKEIIRLAEKLAKHRQETDTDGPPDRNRA